MNILIALKYIFGFGTHKTTLLLSSVILSFSFGGLINSVQKQIEVNDSGLMMQALVILGALTGFFIIIDAITGVSASKEEGHKFTSSKFGATVGKTLGLMMYFTMCAVGLYYVKGSTLVYSAVFAPIVLALLREFVSIGENMERRFGVKPYIFSLIEKLFEVIELRFLTYFRDKKITGDTDDTVDDISSGEEELH